MVAAAHCSSAARAVEGGHRRADCAWRAGPPSLYGNRLPCTATTFLIWQPNLPDGKGRTPLRLLRPIDASANSANLAENLAEADGAVVGALEALVGGGARPDLKDAQGLTFAEWQPDERVQTTARNAAAAYKVRTPVILPTYSRLT